MTHLPPRPPRVSGPLAAVLLLLGGAAWYSATSELPPTHPSVPEVPASLQAKLQQLAAESDTRVAFDRPGEAEAFARSKRLGDPLGAALAAQGLDPPTLYREARLARARLPRYSTRWGRGLSPEEPQSLPGATDLRSRSAAATFGTWESLGPGNIGGRTRALLIDPRNPRVLIAGGVSGGIWKSTDGGATWRPTGDLLANIAVSSLARHPTNPGILYAGTGEGYFREDIRGTALPLRGGGVFESRDGGDTWQRLPATAGPAFHWVNDVLVSPVDGRRLYAATRSGVWRSRNGGGLWQQVLSHPDPAGCIDLEARTDTAGDFLFVTCGLFEQAAVYRHTNAQGGEPWQQVLAEPFQGRTNVAIAPSDPNVVYALAASNEDNAFNQGLLALFRSDDAGATGTWIRVTDNRDPVSLYRFLLSNPVIATQQECGFGESFLSNLGWHANTLAVDPLDPNRVWAGGVDLFRSDDGGRSWGVASYWWAGASVPGFAHADHHEVVFPPGYDGVGRVTAYTVNDGGVYRIDNARAPVAVGNLATCDPANTGTSFRSLNTGYGATQFYHGTPFPDGRSYLGGTQDNGTVLGTDGTGTNGWRRIFGGDGGYVAVDPDNPDILYVEAQLGNLRRSTDRGQTFQDARQGLQDSFLFITPFLLDPARPQRLWIGGSRLWRTDNSAFAWQPASRLLGPGRRVSALAVAFGDPDRLLAGTDQGWIHRTDVGTTADADTGWPGVRPREGFVSSLAFDPRDPEIAYATYARFGGVHVWKTADAGRTWQPLDGGDGGQLPDIPVHSVVVDPRQEERLFLGTDLGVFVSLDGGSSWAVEGTGFANAVTEALAMTESPDGNVDLFAFTHGRGAWRVRLAEPDGEPPETEVPSLRPRRLTR